MKTNIPKTVSLLLALALLFAAMPAAFAARAENADAEQRYENGYRFSMPRWNRARLSTLSSTPAASTP